MNAIMAKPAKDTVKELIKAVEEGDVNGGYLKIVLKKFEKIGELLSANKDVKDLMDNAIKEYQEGTAKTFYAFGAKVTLANGSFWDYSEVDDPYLKALVEIDEQAKKLIKLRQTELQNKKEAWDTVNTPGEIVKFGLKPFMVSWDRIPYIEWEEESGEVSTNPPVKKGAEQIRLTV